MSLSTYRSKVRTSGFSLVVTIPAEIVRDLKLRDGDPVVWTVHGEILTLSIVDMEEALKNTYMPDEKEIKKVRELTQDEIEKFALEMKGHSQ